MPVARLVLQKKSPRCCAFVGSGKADEIRMLAKMHGAVEVLFDQALSPAQQRNLERNLELPVYDRTFLILEIFANARATTRANFRLNGTSPISQHASGTTLVALERQTGGAGVRGGPGEKQIELDRRMIDEIHQAN